MTDYVCNDVLRDSCPEVYEANGLDEESCKATYEALPASEENGDADGNSRGCRILHSTFAIDNKEHCPHVSFLPMEDEKGKIIDIIETGYQLGDRIIRYPKVVVGQ